MSSVIAFINNFLLSIERNEHSSDSNGEEHIDLAPADEAAIGVGVEGDGSNGQPVEDDFCDGNRNESAGGGEAPIAPMVPEADEQEATSDAVEGAGIAPDEEDFFYGTGNESVDGSSEISVALADQGNESEGSYDSDFEADGENVAPVRDRGAVLIADKLVSSNPMRLIVRKTKTKERSPAEIVEFRTRFHEYLLELFSLPNCFCKYQRTFTQCSCLNQLKNECCYDSVSARIGKFSLPTCLFIQCTLLMIFVFAS